MNDAGIVVVGASYAGLNAAAAARTAGYRFPVTLIGDEPRLPYQRPPLSKEFLRSSLDAAQLPLRAASFFESSEISLRTGVTVQSIDRATRSVRLNSGEQLAYDKLILATGCRTRILSAPGADAAGVHYLRTLDDALAIAHSLEGAGCVAVVGGGFIGLEVAASVRRMGKSVAVIEAQARLLSRTLSPEMSSYIAERHRREGVDLHFSAQVKRFQVQAGRVTGVELQDGLELAADAVIVGIGVIPNQELAQAAGLSSCNGVIVDEHARTGDPDIYAAGDCTSHPNAYAPGGMARLECVQNAIDQGRVAGGNAAGANARYSAPPWFWSDQYEVKLQSVGISTGFDRIVTRGDMKSDAFSVFYFAGPRLLSVESVNKPGEHMLARKLLAAQIELRDPQVADPAYDLRAALAK
jgi:3-phenylpropionate/trans-cinnamate dioxygenase ferredoxin reductase subunit